MLIGTNWHIDKLSLLWQSVCGLSSDFNFNDNVSMIISHWPCLWYMLTFWIQGTAEQRNKAQPQLTPWSLHQLSMNVGLFNTNFTKLSDCPITHSAEYQRNLTCWHWIPTAVLPPQNGVANHRATWLHETIICFELRVAGLDSDPYKLRKPDSSLSSFGVFLCSGWMLMSRRLWSPYFCDDTCTIYTCTLSGNPVTFTGCMLLHAYKTWQCLTKGLFFCCFSSPSFVVHFEIPVISGINAVFTTSAFGYNTEGNFEVYPWFQTAAHHSLEGN